MSDMDRMEACLVELQSIILKSMSWTASSSNLDISIAAAKKVWDCGYRKPLTRDEMEEWISKSFSHLNPDVLPFFLMGIEALHVKLDGKKFITVK